MSKSLNRDPTGSLTDVEIVLRAPERPRDALDIGRGALEIAFQRVALPAKKAQRVCGLRRQLPLAPCRALNMWSKPSGRIARVPNVEKSARTETRPREATSHLTFLTMSRARARGAGSVGGIRRHAILQIARVKQTKPRSLA